MRVSVCMALLLLPLSFFLVIFSIKLSKSACMNLHLPAKSTASLLFEKSTKEIYWRYQDHCHFFNNMLCPHNTIHQRTNIVLLRHHKEESQSMKKRTRKREKGQKEFLWNQSQKSPVKAKREKDSYSYVLSSQLSAGCFSVMCFSQSPPPLLSLLDTQKQWERKNPRRTSGLRLCPYSHVECSKQRKSLQKWKPLEQPLLPLILFVDLHRIMEVNQVDHLNVVGRKELTQWINNHTASSGAPCTSIESCAGGYQACVLINKLFPG